tara:strand:+ start:4591 stop:6306 length:1716 start_codon:yes stop_codon:yes gene_type:complete
MNSNLILLFLAFLMLINSACSSSKWVVENQYETDRNDFSLLNANKFLERIGTTSPKSPIVNFQLKSENTFEYAQRVKTDRYIQRYRPTFRSVFFGLIGAGIASTAALTVSETNTSKNTLLGTAGFVTIASILNMKPVGVPTPTGETRLLRKTGKIEETEIVTTIPEPDDRVSVAIFNKGNLIIEAQEVKPVNSLYSVNLLELLNPEFFEYDSSDVIELQLYYNEKVYKERIPLINIFERFIVISSQVTALRDEPKFDSKNILTDLALGSQMKLVSEDSLWYKVLYGISETWISKNDANPIWRPSEFASQLSIIAIPNIPFGNVDVENNISSLTTVNNNDSFAFILTNGEYQSGYSERTYASRDALLIEEYLEKGFNIPEGNISKALNISSQQQLNLAYNRLANKLRSPQKRIVVYLSGYVTTTESGELGLIPTEQEDQNDLFNLNSLLVSISNLPVEQVVIFADLDFIDNKGNSELLELISSKVIENNPNSVIIFGSTENQRSRDYSVSGGDQKRHSIFTYFLAEAFKNKQTSISGIINHLQRNVDYTSRRLHNQPQNVIFFGDTGISLVE